MGSVSIHRAVCPANAAQAQDRERYPAGRNDGEAGGGAGGEKSGGSAGARNLRAVTRAWVWRANVPGGHLGTKRNAAREANRWSWFFAAQSPGMRDGPKAFKQGKFGDVCGAVDAGRYARVSRFANATCATL